MDINPISIGKALLGLVEKDFPLFQCGQDPTEPEKDIAKEILKHFYNVLTDYTFEEEEELCLVGPGDSQYSSYSQTLADESGQILDEKYDDIVSVERKAEILKVIAMHPAWSITSLQANECKEFKYPYYRKRWEEQVNRGGTAYEKFKFIDRFVYDKFEEARNEFKFIRQRDLQLWGIQAAQSFRDSGFSFKAGLTWAKNFISRHELSSRKVTKLVGRREIKDMETILETAKRFQEKFRRITDGIPPDQILNTDQVGFMYEIPGNRTLSYKGEKDTLGVAKSPTNLATHSYTAQYVISKAGKIVGDVFLCLQERSGRLGPLVKEGLFPAANVCVTCSVSGKLTTSLYEYFLDEVLVRSIKEDFTLMIDSWSGQTNPASYEERFGVNGVPNCSLQIIPKKCTSILQPLDTTFHRQLKYFARLVYHEASLRYSSDVNPVDEITTRNNIIRLHSLLHNQLSAPVFQPMIKYSWYSAGLTDDRPTFLTVKDVCFSFEKADGPNCDLNCGKTRFVRCAHCRKKFCFECFYYNYHFHPT